MKTDKFKFNLSMLINHSNAVNSLCDAVAEDFQPVGLNEMSDSMSSISHTEQNANRIFNADWHCDRKSF